MTAILTSSQSPIEKLLFFNLTMIDVFLCEMLQEMKMKEIFNENPILLIGLITCVSGK